MIKKAGILFSLLFLLSCRSSNEQLVNEGFQGEILYVYIYEFIPDHYNYKIEKLQSLISERLNDRAFRILACYVSLHLNRDKVSGSTDEILNKTVQQILSERHLIRSDCYDNGYCDAFAEYNVKKLFDEIDVINNR